MHQTLLEVPYAYEFLIFTTTLRRMYEYEFHFTNAETETQGN